MASINKVILLGRLGSDPKIMNTQSGVKVATFSVATSETWKDKSSGEKKERTEWHSVVVYNTICVDVAERYLRKGNQVYIEGQLQTRKWEDNSGQERFKTEIVIQNYSGNLILLEKKEGDSQPVEDKSNQAYDDLDDSDIPF